MTPDPIPRFVLITSDQPVCDFCAQTPVCWRYPAQTFRDLDAVAMYGGRLTTDSVGDWAACNACHDLIEHNDAEALAKRTADTMPNVAGVEIPYDVAVEYARNLHSGFFTHRTGPAQEHPPEKGESVA